tara:strand:- start:2243 stop:2518 length:276 start_codon:yes stop_codon:yes gene_type:complete
MTRPHFTDDFKVDAIKQITERGYSVEIYTFTLKGTPKPFDHAIVNPTPLAIHGYLYTHILQRLRPFKTCELPALIAVHCVGILAAIDDFSL